MNFVIFRLSSLGDIIYTLPVVDTLKNKFPNSTITYVAKKQFTEVLQYKNNIEKVITFDKNHDSLFSIAHEILKAEPDYFIDLHNTYRSFIIKSILSPFVKTLTIKRRPLIQEICVRLHLKKVNNKDKMAIKFLKTVRSLVPEKEWIINPTLDYKINKEAAVGILPFSNWETKNLHPDQLTTIINNISEDTKIYIFGAKKDITDFKNIERNLKRPVINLIGETTITDMIDYISRCSIFLSPDSGALHIAMALGVPSIAIFGPTDPNQFDFSNHFLIYNNQTCSPCHFYGEKRCHLKHHSCIKKLNIDHIIDIINRFSQQENSSADDR